VEQSGSTDVLFPFVACYPCGLLEELTGFALMNQTHSNRL
jgi:hypothetical protein